MSLCVVLSKDVYTRSSNANLSYFNNEHKIENVLS